MRIDRKKLKEALVRDGQHTAMVKGTSIQIKLLRRGFHIIVKADGKPLTYVYRDQRVAVDRFCEQVAYFWRA